MTSRLPLDLWENHFQDFLQSVSAIVETAADNTTIRLRNIDQCIAVRSGRTALFAAIRALDLPLGAPIAVPLYSCPVVFKSIG